ncbi:MAG: DUF2726 domain-containing protein [Deltaproteobacteria bacterium]|jgi:hypothetical protein|nr:DUF2726 domain-containing protein [Deltaproteobacteria bacterium]
MTELYNILSENMIQLAVGAFLLAGLYLVYKRVKKKSLSHPEFAEQAAKEANKAKWEALDRAGLAPDGNTGPAPPLDRKAAAKAAKEAGARAKLMAKEAEKKAKLDAKLAAVKARERAKAVKKGLIPPDSDDFPEGVPAPMVFGPGTPGGQPGPFGPPGGPPGPRGPFDPGGPAPWQNQPPSGPPGRAPAPTGFDRVGPEAMFAEFASQAEEGFGQAPPSPRGSGPFPPQGPPDFGARNPFERAAPVAPFDPTKAAPPGPGHQAPPAPFSPFPPQNQAQAPAPPAFAPAPQPFAPAPGPAPKPFEPQKPFSAAPLAQAPAAPFQPSTFRATELKAVPFPERDEAPVREIPPAPASPPPAPPAPRDERQSFPLSKPQVAATALPVAEEIEPGPLPPEPGVSASPPAPEFAAAAPGRTPGPAFAGQTRMAAPINIDQTQMPKSMKKPGKGDKKTVTIQDLDVDYEKTSFMTPLEIVYYKLLRGALKQYLIFPRVTTKAVVKATSPDAEHQKIADNVLNSTNLSFIVCDVRLNIRAIVEIVDENEIPTNKDKARDYILKKAGCLLVRFYSGDKPPDAETLKVRIMGSR